MTQSQFSAIYRRLADAYPTQFNIQGKANAIAQEVKELDAVWFEKLVTKAIAANDPFFKLGEFITAEKRRINQDYATSEQARDFEQMKHNSTAMGFNAELRKRNAASLWEAVENEKKGKGA